MKKHHLPELPKHSNKNSEHEKKAANMSETKNTSERTLEVSKKDETATETSQDTVAPEGAKPEEKTPPDKIESENKPPEVKLPIKIKKKKPKHKKLQRKSLQQYLEKAGFDAEAPIVKRWLYISVFVAVAIVSVFVLWHLGCWNSDICMGRSITAAIFFFICIWTIVFGFAILIGLGLIYFFLDYRIYKRTKQLEEVLPDFLQLASANIAAGMPIDRALWYSIRPTFGVLAKEMEEVAKATMSGEDLERSLIMFTEKYESMLLKRSISILIEGLRSGGELADLLNKIALNIDEIKIMKKEMAANVMTYAIFIIVAAVGIAPALFALATELLSIIVEITSSLDLSSTSSFFSIGAVDPLVVRNFTFFSYSMLIVSSVFGACIVSVIRRGNVMEGIKSIPVYAIIAILIYKISFSFLQTAFGSLI